MENTEAKVYSEVNALIKMMGSTYQNMLPASVKKSIYEKCDKNYTPQYSVNIPLAEQNIQADSLAIMANIQYNYFCKSDKEKQDFLNDLHEIDKKIEKEKLEKYNPDDIFKDSKKDEQEEKTENNTYMIECKESFLQRIINKIKKIFYK